VTLIGRFARDALAQGAGEVCALFRRSFYLRCPGERYACVGDASLGRGPLNVLVEDLALPALGARIEVSPEHASVWKPPPFSPPDLPAIVRAAHGHLPAEGLGCLVVGSHNALSVHAQPALEALERWLRGNALEAEAQALIGLGPGLTPSGDDYLGGMLVALHALGREAQARGLWRWLQPRLSRTSAISGAHLEAAAAGEAHEVLHEVLSKPSDVTVRNLKTLGHCSGWDALAGAVAVLRAS
jgi:Protein of unknown function (DUF2877)